MAGSRGLSVGGRVGPPGVSNDVYARFRAAIFWLLRNPRAAGHVPENMSVAVEQALEVITADLEQRFNGGERFPESPPTRRRRRKQADS